MKRILNPKQEAEAVDAFLAGEPGLSIGNRLGVSYDIIRRTLLGHGVKLSRAGRKCAALYAIPVDERRRVAERYEAGESGLSLARSYGVDGGTIANILAEQGVVRRSHRDSCVRLRTHDEGVFDSPTEEGRYWIGLLMADGCVRKDKNYDTWTVSLVASEKDASHVEAFKSFLKSDAPVTRRKGRLHKFPQGHVSASKPHVCLSLTSKRLAEALSKYGVTRRKSLTARVLGLERCPRFWAGAVDGDGFVGWQNFKKGSWHSRVPLVGLCGSTALVGQFRDFVKEIAPGSCARVQVKNEGRLAVVRFTGQSALKVLRALYDDAPFALPRKRQKAVEVISEYEARLVERELRRSAPRPLCSVAGCIRECVTLKSTICSMHARRLARHGSTEALRKRKSLVAQCSAPNCLRQAKTCGLCARHYATPPA